MSDYTLLCPTCHGEDIRESMGTGLVTCYSSKICRWNGPANELLIKDFDAISYMASVEDKISPQIITWGSPEWDELTEKINKRKELCSAMVELLKLSVTDADLLLKAAELLRNNYIKAELFTIAHELEIPPINLNLPKGHVIEIIVKHTLSLKI